MIVVETPVASGAGREAPSTEKVRRISPMGAVPDVMRAARRSFSGGSTRMSVTPCASAVPSR